MLISVASGKGGTGKTFVAVNLAASAEFPCQLVDCDVEEPNVHLFLKPTLTRQEKVFKRIPQVNPSQCQHCGQCQKVCAYHAIAVIGKKVLVFPELCHGCGACAYFCPHYAISEYKQEIGLIELGNAGSIRTITGKLAIAQTMAPPVIRQAKKFIDPQMVTIIDAPPGTSCPVIESVKGSDLTLLVTEPTPFGLHDLILGVEVLRKLKIPFGVVVNRCNVGNQETQRYCQKEQIDILMSIPFDQAVAQAYSRGEVVVDTLPDYRKVFLALWRQIKEKRGYEKNSDHQR